LDGREKETMIFSVVLLVVKTIIVLMDSFQT
jgi:hypothetical protein